MAFCSQTQYQNKGCIYSRQENFLADQLSSVKIRPSEWTLKDTIVQSLFNIWDQPMIDLFASVDNHKTLIFCSWFPDKKALAVDALSILWEGMMPHAFPPICLIPKVLQHMSRFHCQILLIASQWPRRHWYTNLLQLLIAVPKRLPVIPEMLLQPKTKIFHPDPGIFKLRLGCFQQKFQNKRLSKMH